MKSPVVKRSIVIAGHKTSVSVEDAFWNSLKKIAANMKAEVIIQHDARDVAKLPVLPEMKK